MIYGYSVDLVHVGFRDAVVMDSTPVAVVSPQRWLPVEITILSFRQWLKNHDLGPQILGIVKVNFIQNSLAMDPGLRVDASTIAAPNSTLIEGLGRAWWLMMKSCHLPLSDVDFLTVRR